ncbi:MAG: hypothetical protein AB7L41_05550 [Flavobacteriaceae bacterium]
MLSKTLMTVAAAGFAALTFSGAAEAGSRGSVHINTPGFGLHIGGGSHYHGRYGYRPYCKPIYKTQRYWTRYGWQLRRVVVGNTCDRYRWGSHGRRW